MIAHDFEAIRAELGLPSADHNDEFPTEVMAEAASIAAVGFPDLDDETSLPFVTIDPAGARDLDQAVYLERRGAGFRVHYAIADLGGAIPPGGAVDHEARRRGQTIYLPDGRVPLHPPTLSEGALSLLPGQVRAAVLWVIDVDENGAATCVDVKRAMVTSVAQLDYEGVQASIDAGSPHPSIEALADLGRLRRAVRVQLGAIELALPEQEVVPDRDTPPSGSGRGWKVRMRVRTAVDGWNAEISLLTGMAAADLMLSAGVGLLRTLPPSEDGDRREFLRTARSLGLTFEEGATASEVLAGLDPDLPVSIALMREATRLLRGAAYEAFDGAPPALATHAGVGGAYAHVTAPLRRLVDRFGTQICLAVSQQQPVPAWVRDALPGLGDIMRESDQRAAKADRACIDQAEAWELAGRVGETFEAIVIRSEREGAEIMLLAPPTLATCRGEGLPEGQQVVVRLAEVDAVGRKIVFVHDGALASP